ncbi:MAG: methylated-DNA--[Bacteroidales bacterium]|nr:methylated-DNA--[protein]-cysteine S-methyltransferase [Bacteroidales bacterium]
MYFEWEYCTPEGFDNLVMFSDGHYLTGVYFEYSKGLSLIRNNGSYTKQLLPIFNSTMQWFDCYFNGEIPTFTPAYTLNNVTPFRKQVLNAMSNISYGHTATYGSIARHIAEINGLRKMSAQAVGGAVGWNPICVIIPCHRVIGSDGRLTGYGGGIKNKKALLSLEGVRCF